MKTTVDPEYLALIKNIAEYQYQEPEEPEELKIECEPVKPEVKWKRLREVTGSAMVDLLNADKNRIRYAIAKYNVLQVGKLTIKITWHHEELCASLTDVTFDLTVYHQVNKTPSGAPANLTVPLNMGKDTRFAEQPWLNYFERERAKSMPLEVLVDMVRFFQVAQKLSAFL